MSENSSCGKQRVFRLLILEVRSVTRTHWLARGGAIEQLLQGEVTGVNVSFPSWMSWVRVPSPAFPETPQRCRQPDPPSASTGKVRRALIPIGGSPSGMGVSSCPRRIAASFAAISGRSARRPRSAVPHAFASSPGRLPAIPATSAASPDAAPRFARFAFRPARYRRGGYGNRFREEEDACRYASRSGKSRTSRRSRW